LLYHEGNQQFSACGHDLFAEDDPSWIHFFGQARSHDRIVIGYDQPVDPSPAAGSQQRFRARQAVL
jgi:hypothetical protein